MPQHKRKARRLHGGGRPRKDGPRTKSGRLSRAIKHNPKLRDEGTKQFVAKRTAMVNGADPQLSATASGILLANGFLTKEQHTAAQRYAWAHATVFSRVWKQQCPLGDADCSQFDVDDLAGRTSGLRLLCSHGVATPTLWSGAAVGGGTLPSSRPVRDRALPSGAGQHQHVKTWQVDANARMASVWQS
jgi:hypothetical protein